jgi:hypothetical protein
LVAPILWSVLAVLLIVVSMFWYAQRDPAPFVAADDIEPFTVLTAQHIKDEGGESTDELTEITNSAAKGEEKQWDEYSEYLGRITLRSIEENERILPTSSKLGPEVTDIDPLKPPKPRPYRVANLFAVGSSSWLSPGDEVTLVLIGSSCTQTATSPPADDVSPDTPTPNPPETTGIGGTPPPKGPPCFLSGSVILQTEKATEEGLTPLLLFIPSEENNLSLKELDRLLGSDDAPAKVSVVVNHGSVGENRGAAIHNFLQNRIFAS